MFLGGLMARLLDDLAAVLEIATFSRRFDRDTVLNAL
jgi:hypothetical protein